MMYCKSVLGVNRKTCNAGIRGELGMLPAFINVMEAIFIFCKILESLEPGCLLKKAYKLSMNEHENGIFTWFSGVKQLCSSILGRNIKGMCHMTKSEIFRKLKTLYVRHWQEQFNKGDGVGKLHLCSNIKQSFRLENYLDEVKNNKCRYSLTKLRISAHSLEIEKGRYYKIPRHNRICKVCKNGVGDEIHFLTNCTFLHSERK